MMRKSLLVLLALCLVGAQSGWAKPAFGVRAGLNLANVSVDPDPGIDLKMKAGFMIGGSGELSISPSNTMTIGADVMYVQKGTKVSDEASEQVDGYYVNYKYESTASIDELVIAPFFAVRFPSGKVTPFLRGGPELGINVSAKEKYERTFETDIPGYESGSESGTDDIENWSSTNFSLNLGGGIAIPSGKGEIVIEARYNLGLLNMDTYKEEAGEEDTTVKTNGIQIMVGYNFSIPMK